MRDTSFGYAIATGVRDDIMGTFPSPLSIIVNNDPVWVVPGDEVWEPVSFYGRLATSAIVANRQVSIVVDDGTNTLARAVSATVQTASLTLDYTAFPGAANAGSNISGAGNTLPIPDIVLLPGWRLRASTLNLAGTDGWSLARLVVRRRIRTDQVVTADDVDRETDAVAEYEHLVERLGL